MANADRPRGARPVKQLDGSAQFPMNPYDVDASNGTAIFVGDFLKLEADGHVAPATAGDELVGVCAGVKDDYDDLSRRHLPASTAGTVFVYDSPYTIFEVQEDDGGTSLDDDDVGALVDIVAGSGDTTTDISAHELDQDSVGTASGQLRLYYIVDTPNNAAGDNADWHVMINEHAYKGVDGV